MSLRFLFVLCCFGITLNGSSQQNEFDSLYNIAVNSKTDYDKALNYDNAGHKLAFINPDSALSIAKIGLTYAIKSKNDTLISDSYYSLSIFFRYLSNYDESIFNSKKAIEHAKKVNALRQIVNAEKSLGITYTEQGNYSLAIEIFYKQLFQARNRKDTNEIAQISTNLANVYFYQELYPKALSYFEEAYKCAVDMKSEFGQSLLLGNIGGVYQKLNQFDLALDYYNKSNEIAQKIEDYEGLGANYGNISSTYYTLEKYDQALDYRLKSLKIKEEMNNLYGISQSWNELGKIYQMKKNIQKGLTYSTKALDLAEQIGAKDLVKEVHETIYKMYTDINNPTKAFIHFKKFIELRDSLFNESNRKKDMRTELNFLFQKQLLTDSIEQAKKVEIFNQKVEAEQYKVASQKKLTLVFSIGFVLMMILAVFIFKEYRAKKKSYLVIQQQKIEVEKQKQLVEEKNKEISDSITYAKRIQEAILPSRYSLTEHLKNGFVLYKPKDIVSGDFYWMENYKNHIYFAAADCTGHGVPGAMVSVVCANALSKALLEENQTETGKLLDRTRELVVERFTKNDENVKDGMDISLCRISNNQLQWSGANNPLWIIRKNGKEVEEIKANKQPIGKTDNSSPFTAHEIQLNPEDTIYIFTDGFADQFGGEKGKKFMYKQLKELLLTIQHLKMDEQREKLNQAFINWQGSQEQVDDVCIIGVRV